MKNREKYSHEILKTIMGADSCDFMKDTVAPLYLDSRESGDAICKKIGCTGCMKLFAFWLDAEYDKPPTDWVNVPVDTLVRVRDNESGKWILRYFKGFSKESPAYPPGYDYEVWSEGTTSVTANECTERWKYCELAEDAAETE